MRGKAGEWKVIAILFLLRRWVLATRVLAVILIEYNFGGNTRVNFFPRLGSSLSIAGRVMVHDELRIGGSQLLYTAASDPTLTFYPAAGSSRKVGVSYL